MNKNRGVIVLLLFLFITAYSISTAAADPTQIDILAQSVEEQLRTLNLEELLGFVDSIDPEFQEFVPALNWQTISSQGLKGLNLIDILNTFVRALFKEVIFSSYLMRQLLVAALLSAVLRQLQLSVEDKGIINIGLLVCFLVIIYIGLQSFRSALALAYQSLDDMVSFMYALLPMLATLVASVGGITSAAIFHPVLIAVVSGVAFLIRTVLFPLLNVSAVVGLLVHISPDFPLTRLSGLLKHLSTMLLSFVFTIFLGVLAVRGAVAPVADGVALRAAKFLTSNVVPVIGSMFANAVEVVVGGSLLIKNTVGMFGMLIIFLLVALPIIKIWAIVLIYRIVAALVEPVSDKRIAEVVGSMAGSLTLVMVSLATVALMFFLTITILVGIGNLAAVMR